MGVVGKEVLELRLSASCNRFRYSPLMRRMLSSRLVETHARLTGSTWPPWPFRSPLPRQHMRMLTDLHLEEKIKPRTHRHSRAGDRIRQGPMAIECRSIRALGMHRPGVNCEPRFAVLTHSAPTIPGCEPCCYTLLEMGLRWHAANGVRKVKPNIIPIPRSTRTEQK